MKGKICLTFLVEKFGPFLKLVLGLVVFFVLGIYFDTLKTPYDERPLQRFGLFIGGYVILGWFDYTIDEITKSTIKRERYCCISSPKIA